MRIPMKLATSAFGLAISILGTGCPLLDVTAEVPEACLTYKDIQIEGVAAEAAHAVHTVFTFDDLAGFAELEQYDAALHFTRGTITATHGVGNLAFIASAKLDIASGDPDSTLPTRTFYDCALGDCPAAGKSMDLQVSDRDDAIAYITSGSLVVALDATGNMPTEAWTMDAELCVEGSASYSR